MNRKPPIISIHDLAWRPIAVKEEIEADIAALGKDIVRMLREVVG